jgi:hypothetical protein
LRVPRGTAAGLSHGTEQNSGPPASGNGDDRTFELSYLGESKKRQLFFVWDFYNHGILTVWQLDPTFSMLKAKNNFCMRQDGQPTMNLYKILRR